MGYLINPNPLGNYQKVIIPESFLQNIVLADSYFINTNLGSDKFWFLTFATFRLINSTVNYDGFSHITLGQSGGLNQGVLETSIAAIPGELDSISFYTFSYNQQHSPNKLGCFTRGPRYQIGFTGTYVSGNGDIELHFYYNEITI